MFHWFACCVAAPIPEPRHPSMSLTQRMTSPLRTTGTDASGFRVPGRCRRVARALPTVLTAAESSSSGCGPASRRPPGCAAVQEQVQPAGNVFSPAQPASRPGPTPAWAGLQQVGSLVVQLIQRRRCADVCWCGWLDLAVCLLKSQGSVDCRL